jgi:RNA polymerase sigma-70 factor, ECF subfamily
MTPFHDSGRFYGMDAAGLGVPLSFEDLVRNHQKGVWRYLRFLGCEPHQADDLTQEAFLRVLRSDVPSVAAMESGPAAAAYLRQVARHLFLDACRREKREIPTKALENADAVWDRYAGRDGGESYLENLRDCLQGLDDRSRAVLEARYGANRSRETLASAFGLSQEGAKTLLRRAKDRLRQCLEGKLRHE